MNTLVLTPYAAAQNPASVKALRWWFVLCLLGFLAACSPAQRHEPSAGTEPVAPSSPPVSTPAAPTPPAFALPPRGSSANYGQRQDAMAWADEVALRTGWPRDWVRQQIAQASRQDAVARAMTPAATRSQRNWRTYRARFVDPVRTQAGLEFWQRHADTLARAEKQYGVPASLIVGIIGVETLYGRHLGQHRVIDALATLAFDFPTAHPREPVRSAFFQQELQELLALSREQNLDAQSLRGSFAGAMGWPQFLPSSWRRYAVDLDRDGQIDLLNNPVDVIGSVANYFVAFGWTPGMPTHYPVQLEASPQDLAELLEPDIVPTFDVNTFIAKGARVSGPALNHPGLLALVELENASAASSHIAGTQNFYVVTRYNWSSYYALAVIELGQHIEALRLLGQQAPIRRPIKAKTKPAQSTLSR